MYKLQSTIYDELGGPLALQYTTHHDMMPSLRLPKFASLKERFATLKIFIKINFPSVLHDSRQLATSLLLALGLRGWVVG